MEELVRKNAASATLIQNCLKNPASCFCMLPLAIFCKLTTVETVQCILYCCWMLFADT